MLLSSQAITLALGFVNKLMVSGKAVDQNGYTIYAIWIRESLMKDYVSYLESIKKTLSDASVFSFPVI